MECISRPVLRWGNVSGKGWAVQDSSALLCFMLNTRPPISAPLALIGRLIQNRSTNKSDSLPESPLGPWELGRGRSRQSLGELWGKGPELLCLGKGKAVRHCPVAEGRGNRARDRLQTGKQPAFMGWDRLCSLQ